jgi:hypothetical protein
MKSKILSKVQYDPEKIHKTGFCGFEGITCMQRPDAFLALFDLIEEQKFKTIIEIGTAAGGLTTFLIFAIESLGITCNLHTYEVHDRPYFNKLKGRGVDINIKNVFDPDKEGYMSELVGRIQNPGPTLVLCDGGNKIKEFNTLSKFLKTGDIIMCHDYSKDRNFFENEVKNKIWNFCESTYKDIETSVIEYGLHPFKEEVFWKCVWSCFVKQ